MNRTELFEFLKENLRIENHGQTWTGSRYANRHVLILFNPETNEVVELGSFNIADD